MPKIRASPERTKNVRFPDAAASAVYDAAKAQDGNALLAIFGPGATDLVSSGDPVQDKAGREHFASSYDQMHRWGKLTSGAMVLNIGADNYPFPFPLRRNSSGQWYFDSTEAKDEILVRRIGGNELATIDSLNAMADAQAEYFSDTHDGSKVHQYAQKFVSDEGEQNGLYWKVAENQPESPLGPLAANASADGYGGSSQQTPQPFHGYFYRMLTNKAATPRRRQKLYRQWKHDRRLRHPCLSRGLSQFRRDDLHDRSGRTGVAKGFGRRHRECRQGH